LIPSDANQKKQQNIQQQTMKFCKNLQRVVEISDPTYSPFWVNYKMLKKLIKELPSLVPADEGNSTQKKKVKSTRVGRPESPDSIESSGSTIHCARQQHHGDKTTEGVKPSSELGEDHTNKKSREAINKSPGEVAFFKLLHAEFKKASHFFEKAQQEFIIREERVREGMEIMKQPNSIMVSEKWSLLAKSLYRLYKDLLLLETFAIMTYCSFSKILKKHDKVTGYSTRNAFMANVVNKANFTNYPTLLEMIKRCEKMYEEVSDQLTKEGKEGLYEDERLFINMIHRLNEQCLDTAEVEGAPERKEVKRPSANMDENMGTNFDQATASLRSVLSDMNPKIQGKVLESIEGDESDIDRKRGCHMVGSSQAKRQRTNE